MLKHMPAYHNNQTTAPTSRCFWITGLSGSGKTTVANAMVQQLGRYGIKPLLLDGDELRQALPHGQGYTYEDRKKLANSYARLAKLFTEQGHFVICATISMYDSVRAWNRKNIPGYHEVYLKVDLQTLKARDPKALYANATCNGDAPVIGLNTTFEEPKQPDMIFISESQLAPTDIAQKILESTTLK